MRALVTGCAGFIGSHLTDALLADGHEVVGVDVRSPAQPASGGFAFVCADLAAADVRALVGDVDVVFHLAGEPSPRASFGPRLHRYVRNNVAATQRLLAAAARRRGVRVV